MKFPKPSVIALGVLAVFTAVASAQQPQAQPGQQKQQEQQGERQRTEESTLTGCLAKGSAEGQYVLTEKGGMKTTITPSSGVELDKHAANHTVKLTGTKGAGASFTATKVDHVSATCDTQ
jgi:hypothetical protein